MAIKILQVGQILRNSARARPTYLQKAASARCISSSTSSLQNDTSSSSTFKYEAPWLLNNNNGDSNSIPIMANFINGHFNLPQNLVEKELYSPDSCIPLYDPSTNVCLSHIYESCNDDNDDLNYAVECAKNAFPSWSATPVQTRQRLLMDYAHLLHKKSVREEIAYWITLEQGKTMGDAMGDVWRGLEVVEAAVRVGRDMLVSEY